MGICIKDATIIDGTGKGRYKGSIYIEGERIKQIIIGEPALNEKVEIIEGTGLICAPGFIDTHSHSDLVVLSSPQLLPKLEQGITTEVLGQDGISMAPLPLKYIAPWQKNIAGLDGKDESLDWHYETTANYLRCIEAAEPALNETYLLPHGNVRMQAMGLDDRPPTKQELEKMCDIVREEMENGCYGLSSGLIYMPCAYAGAEELIALCKIVSAYKGVFVVHQRSEADDILESMDEIIKIGKASGVNVHFSHFKVCGKSNWGKLEAMLRKLDEAKKEGVNVSFDQYPYVAGSTMLGVILPPWVHDGGTEELVKRLQDKALRKKIKEDIEKGIPGWDNFIQFAGTEGIFITSVESQENQDVVGLSLDDLGKKRGKEALEAAFDLLLEENNAVGMVDFYGIEEHVKTIMSRPEMNVCTDGLLSGKPHPRVYGAFPRVLSKYVRQEKVLTLEEAIYKMTGKAAQAIGIKERGIIKEGYYADLVLFDFETVKDKGTFQNPKQTPEGIVYVIVNGKLAIKKGIPTQIRGGHVLRKGKG